MPEETYQTRIPPQRVDTHCFLCGKTRQEVRKLILGERGGICLECVGLCVQVIEMDRAEGAPAEGVSVGGGNSDTGGASAV